jgi:hypothetical protein
LPPNEGFISGKHTVSEEEYERSIEGGRNEQKVENEVDSMPYGSHGDFHVFGSMRQGWR